MANLTVIVGYCGSGKSTLLTLLKSACPRLETMDEGFAVPGNERDRTERARIIAALVAGHDCAITSMECAFEPRRADMLAAVEQEAPGTTIVWLVYENNRALADTNCRRDPARVDVPGNVAQNARFETLGYTSSADARPLRIYALPPPPA